MLTLSGITNPLIHTADSLTTLRQLVRTSETFYTIFHVGGRHEKLENFAGTRKLSVSNRSAYLSLSLCVSLRCDTARSYLPLPADLDLCYYCTVESGAPRDSCRFVSIYHWPIRLAVYNIEHYDASVLYTVQGWVEL